MVNLESIVPALALMVTVLLFLRSRARRRAFREGAVSGEQRKDLVANLVDAAEWAHKLFALGIGVVVLVVVVLVARSNEIAAWILGGTGTLLFLLYLAAKQRRPDAPPQIDDDAIEPR